MGNNREKEEDEGDCWGWFMVAVLFAVVAAALVVAFRSKFHHPEKAPPVPGPPGLALANYSAALKLSLQFFDIQKAGKLKDNKISWRGDSALDDGKEAEVDLSKGLYDSGDHMKFGFPMAFTATVLSWAILEYGDQMDVVNQLEPAQENLKWMTDYFINAHPRDNVLFIQVGDPDLDHKCWERPENMTEKRPVIQINTTAPGTEVAAETAAAMAAASLVFRKSNSTYSGTLLQHSKQLFDFADNHRGSYSKNIPKVATYYNSTGYGDELLWAATWLYHATNDRTFLQYVNDNGKKFANFGSPTWFSWDNKLAGTQVLLSRVNLFAGKDVPSSANSGLHMYRETAEAVMCGLIPNSPTATSSRTDSGLVWVSQWNALQHPVAAAFLAVVYSDYMLSSRTASISCSGKFYMAKDLRKFAISQVDYVLGNNPMKMSFLVGYGNKYPQYVHHRGASIPADAKTGCDDGFIWLNTTKPNPNICVGALVGGPFLNETFIDFRNNSMQVEPTTYNNALFVGLLSGLVTTSSVVQSFI